jgi:hypothetical protein
MSHMLPEKTVRPAGCFIGKIHRDIEVGDIAILTQDRPQHKLFATLAVKDTVITVGHALQTVPYIHPIGVHLLTEGIVEIQLFVSKFVSTLIRQGGPYLEMDVRCPAVIPAGENGKETDMAAIIGFLITAQKFQA